MEMTTGHLILLFALITAHFLPSLARARLDAGRWKQKAAVNMALIPLWVVILAVQSLDYVGAELRPAWTNQALLLAAFWALYRANQLDLVEERKPDVEPLDLRDAR